MPYEYNHFADSSGSQDTCLRIESQESTEKEWGKQPSISLKEWEIPFDDLEVGPKIGSGQFSTGEIWLQLDDTYILFLFGEISLRSLYEILLFQFVKEIGMEISLLSF